MKLRQNWRNKSSLREKYGLMNLLGLSPMEVADPIATLNYYSNKAPSDNNSEQK